MLTLCNQNQEQVDVHQLELKHVQQLELKQNPVHQLELKQNSAHQLELKHHPSKGYTYFYFSVIALHSIKFNH